MVYFKTFHHNLVSHNEFIFKKSLEKKDQFHSKKERRRKKTSLHFFIQLNAILNRSVSGVWNLSETMKKVEETPLQHLQILCHHQSMGIVNGDTEIYSLFSCFSSCIKRCNTFFMFFFLFSLRMYFYIISCLHVVNYWYLVTTKFINFIFCQE